MDYISWLITKAIKWEIYKRILILNTHESRKNEKSNKRSTEILGSYEKFFKSALKGNS